MSLAGSIETGEPRAGLHSEYHDGPEIEVEISDTQGHLRVDPAELSNARTQRAGRGGSLGTRRSRSPWSINATIHALNRRTWATTGRRTSSASRSRVADDPVLAGELVVSAEMAVATGARVGVEPRDELALYVVHGLLHLCGYDDHDDADRRRMRQREDELLAQAGLTNPYPRDEASKPFDPGERAPPGSQTAARDPSAHP